MHTSARPDPARTVDAIAASVFVQSMGAAAVLPLLPLYLRREHTSVGLVGVVMASFFAAAVLTQYGAGQVSDRIGHRRVMLGGLVLYAGASVAFLLPVGPGGFVVLRSLQGIGAGAFQIAGLALVGGLVPLERRGRAFAKVFAAQLLGLAVGPVLGAPIGVRHMHTLFVLAAVAAVAAMVPTLTRTPPRLHGARQERLRGLRITRPLVGVVLIGVVGGLSTGVYEACWSLLLTSRHAAQWQIGLSWTLFATSFAAFSPVAGRLADRLDRRVLAIGAVTVSTGFLSVYPFIGQPAWLLGLGVVEAVGVAVAFPAAQSLLSQCAAPDALGRAQGVFSTAESAAIAATAGVSGYLLGVQRWLPFVGAAALAVTLIACLPWLWRGVVGRASDATGVVVPGQPEPAPTLTPIA